MWKMVKNKVLLTLIIFVFVCDVTLPLVPGFNLPSNGRSPLWIRLLYEQLVDYCTLCGCIGHRKSYCLAPPTLGVYPNSRKLVSRPASAASSHITSQPSTSSAAMGSILPLQGVSLASLVPLHAQGFFQSSLQ